MSPVLIVEKWKRVLSRQIKLTRNGGAGCGGWSGGTGAMAEELSVVWATSCPQRGNENKGSVSSSHRMSGLLCQRENIPFIRSVGRKKHWHILTGVTSWKIRGGSADS